MPTHLIFMQSDSTWRAAVVFNTIGNLLSTILLHSDPRTRDCVFKTRDNGWARMAKDWLRHQRTRGCEFNRKNIDIEQSTQVGEATYAAACVFNTCREV